MPDSLHRDHMPTTECLMLN